MGDLNVTEEKMFENLLRFDTIRGPHSTGVFKLSKFIVTQPGVLVKDIGTPWDLEEYNVNYPLLFTGLAKLYLGHNRWATKGEITAANAHPFKVGTIVGAHNGTVRNQTKLPDHKNFVVDSENIIHSLDCKGVEETIKNVEGSFALVWYNSVDETLNFIRNNERELYYAFSEDNKKIFWASEKPMLKAVFEKHNQKYAEPVLFEVGHHYRIPIPSYIGHANYPELGKPICKKVELHTYSYHYNGRQNVQDMYGNYWDDDMGGWQNGRRRVGHQGNVIPFTPTKQPLRLPDNSVFKNNKDFPLNRVTPKEVTDLVNTNIFFSTTHREEAAVSSQSFIAGTTSKGYCVKVHVDSRYKEFKEWSFHGTVLKGRVKGIKRDKEGILWIMIKYSTLELVYDHEFIRSNRRTLSQIEKDSNDAKEDHPSEDDDSNRDNSSNSNHVFIVGLSSRIVGKEEFLKLLKDGCGLCSDPLSEADSEDIDWIEIAGKEEPVCGQCALEILKAGGSIQ